MTDQGADDPRPPIWERTRLTGPHLLLFALSLCAALTLVTIASTSTAGFAAYNPGWDGTAEFRQMADDRGPLVHARSTAAYGTVPANETVAVVLAPTSAYDPAERAQLRTFLDSGGTVVVAENFGPYGNDLLSGLGTDTRVDGAVLRDERHHFRSPALPIATDPADEPLAAGVEELTLNYGTAVDPSEEATVVVNTSKFAYLDRNENEQIDDTEDPRRHPIVTTERVGDGTLVVVGDPSLVINSMLAETDNRRFAANLLDTGDVVLIDHTHTSTLPPTVTALLLLREVPILATLVGLGGLGVVTAWYRGFPTRLRRVWRRVDRSSRAAALETARSKPDPEVVRKRLRQRHPEWDDARIDRVITGVLSAQSDEDTNE